MLSRLLSLVIVTFWVLMTGLLLRRELYPESSLLHSVPPAHCLKLVFANAQISDLQIRSDNLPVGHLRLLPSIEKPSQHRIVDFMGQIQLPEPQKIRLTWRGRIELTRGSELVRLRISVNLNDGDAQRTDLLIDRPTNQAQLRVFDAEQIVQEYSATLDEAGFKKLAAQLGLSPTMLPALGVQTDLLPELHAQQSSLRLRGDDIETYLLSVHHSGQTLLELHLSQLGQVLKAKTFLGYQLVSEDLQP